MSNYSKKPLGILLGIVIFLSLACTYKAKTNLNNNEKTTAISILNPSYDFGKIKYPDSVRHTFLIKNTGKIPLIIHSAKASCGCTIPSWSKSPIMPGAVGQLNVTFKPKKTFSGIIRKSIVIEANTDSLFHVFYMTGDVISIN